MVWYLNSTRPQVSAESVIVPIIFAAFGIALGGVTFWGGVTGLGYAFLFYVVAGRRGFSLLFLLFALTLIATRIGERKRGNDPHVPRDPAQVSANLFAAGVLLLVGDAKLQLAYFFASIAVLAEVAADTVSSEIGSAFGGITRSIWGFKQCQPGSEGGVSLLGSGAGLLAATTIVVAYLLLWKELDWANSLLLVVAALFGMVVDSIAGATLEAKGYLGNNHVNLIGTSSAAMFYLGFFPFQRLVGWNFIN